LIIAISQSNLDDLFPGPDGIEKSQETISSPMISLT